jgi:hypothetical protein
VYPFKRNFLRNTALQFGGAQSGRREEIAAACWKDIEEQFLPNPELKQQP